MPERTPQSQTTTPSAGPLQLRTPRRDRKLDELDEKILWELMLDARIPNNTLAQKLFVSPSTTLLRMRRLQEDGIWQSSHAAVDLEAVGLPLQAMVFVRLRAQARPQIKSYAAKLMTMPTVMNAFYLGGPDDFIIHCGCTSPSQLRDFVALQLSRDPAVASTQTHIVFDWHRGEQYMGIIGSFEEARAPIEDPGTHPGSGPGRS